MREKEFEKLVYEVTERVTLNILGAHWVCYRCGDKSVIERVEKLEQKVAKTHADIVRCINCRWWSGKNGGFCDILALNIPDEEFFCAWGEQRREADGDDQ